MTPPEILLFDSGVGGLSVARCVHEQIPSARLSYLADTACFPYGNQPEQLIIERCLYLIKQALVQQPVDVIVIACNTASTAVLPALRAATSVPVVGVVPAIKPAAAVSQNRRIGLLATPATIQRRYMQQLAADFAADCLLETVGHPELVRWIEDYVLGAPLPEAALSLALEPFRQAGVDTVVLGCTHYPLIADVLQRLLPTVRHWVDSGPAIARRAHYLLRQAGFDPDLPGSEGTPVMSLVRFSGAIPDRLESYVRHLGLPTERFIPNWPGGESVITAPA